MSIVRCIHAGNPDSAVCRKQNAVHLFGKGRLSGAVVPQNSHKISLVNVQGQIIDRTLYFFYMVIFIPADIIIY